MGKYRKLIAAIVGVIAIIAGPDVLGLTADTETVVQMVMGLLTAFGVFQLSNDPATTTQNNSPMLVTLLALLVFMASGCVSTLGIDNERLDTANKQLADKVVFVESLADFATRLVQARVISGDEGRRVAGILQRSLNALNETQAAISRSGDPSQASDTLTRVDQSLAIVLDLLLVFAPTQSSALDDYRNQWEITLA